MSRAEDLEKEMAALTAERERLSVVQHVMQDMAYAAMDVDRESGFSNPAAKAKQQHGVSGNGSALGESLAAGERWRELHDRYYDARRAEAEAADRRVRRSGIERSR